MQLLVSHIWLTPACIYGTFITRHRHYNKWLTRPLLNFYCNLTLNVLVSMSMSQKGLDSYQRLVSVSLPNVLVLVSSQPNLSTSWSEELTSWSQHDVICVYLRYIGMCHVVSMHFSCSCKLAMACGICVFVNEMLLCNHRHRV